MAQMTTAQEVAQEEEDLEWSARIADIVYAEGILEQHVPAQLMEGLFLSGLSEARRADLLQELGVQAVVNMAPESCRRDGHDGYEDGFGIEVLKQDALDDWEYPLLEFHLDAVEEFLNRHRMAGHGVLVHCYAGVNRSAAICAAYLIRTHRMHLTDAVKLLVEKRGKVLQNIHFINQLVALARKEDLLQ
mmetsp:Transcript_84145/g.149121  ORF Transcript_84145/g.149121 Transcript_84145/m.149121 type:complete len:189 (-) Transcript_84145:195-761(-)